MKKPIMGLTAEVWVGSSRYEVSVYQGVCSDCYTALVTSSRGGLAVVDNFPSTRSALAAGLETIAQELRKDN